MAPATNWLSFSLSPLEMLRSSSDQSPFMAYDSSTASQYLLDNFYANGWTNQKSQVFFSEGEGKESQAARIGDPPILTSFIHPHTQNHHPVPKLEDFLGDSSSSMVRYSDSQTETHDSSLTQIYDQGSAPSYFNDHHDLKAVTAFQAFSTNSGSEVDDSASVPRTAQLTCAEFTGGGGGGGGAHSIESTGNELGFPSCPTGSLSLGVTMTQSSERAIVRVDSDSSKKISDSFGQRTSIYRGVTRTCLGLVDKDVYLGGYDKEEKAARAYDLAALKYWGPTATTNFPVSNYTKELEEMKHVTKQEFIASLRRKSSGFSRGASIYRGVTRHHQQGRWQARIGRVAGNKDLYLGTFATEEEAAEAYDIAAIKFRGVNAVTNFEMNRYDVEAIAKSALPVGGAAKRLKLSLEAEEKPSIKHDQQACSNSSTTSSNNNINFSALQPVSTIPCGIPFDAATAALYHQNLFHHFQSNYIGNTDAAGSSPAMTTMIPQPAEFFIWPHQSY
ncbi:AP2/ERF transcription factor [Parasponia andersonii]|uniref:AP2/ERF transcription factor n=1 Tax=Parasponia andersonii TaxID=3476 RepID=A0A2P5A8T1_PARAD|nr:AP2/ERF transcription factor [Parasponia andersonii]